MATQYYRQQGTTNVVDGTGKVVPFSGNLDSLQLYSGTLPVTTAPTNAANVNQVPGLTMPNNTPTNPDTSTTSGLLAFYKSQFDTAEQQRKDAETARAAAEATQKSQTQPFLDRILGSKAPSEVRADAEATTGIKPAEYFADAKARIAEIDALNSEYNNVKMEKDKQIAATRDVLGSNNFINNQIQQIERNAAPRLNMISANINAKSAVLQASQGLFEEAQSYVSKAVSDATADLKFNFDMFNTFYTINQDVIDRLDIKYKDALSDARSAAEKSYTLAYDEKTKVGELMISNPQASINITDTLDQAMAKVGAKPMAQKGEIFGSAETGYKERYYDPATNTYKTRTISGGTGTGGGVASNAGFKDSKIESSVREDATALLYSQGLSPADAYKQLRTLYSPNEATDTALRALVGLAPETTKTTSAGSTAPAGTSRIETDIAKYKAQGMSESAIRTQLKNQGYAMSQIDQSSAAGLLGQISSFLFGSF